MWWGSGFIPIITYQMRNSNIFPIISDFMITEDGEYMLTESGDFMITED